ncbi:antitoxin, partial [Nocardioides sp. BGMRC 2183]
MGFLDDAKKKLSAAVDKHGDKIDSSIDKAADFADKKTGGKYRGQIQGGVGKAKDALDKLDGRDDDLGPGQREQPGNPGSTGKGTPPPPPPGPSTPPPPGSSTP